MASVRLMHDLQTNQYVCLCTIITARYWFSTKLSMSMHTIILTARYWFSTKLSMSMHTIILTARYWFSAKCSMSMPIIQPSKQLLSVTFISRLTNYLRYICGFVFLNLDARKQKNKFY